MTTGIGGLDMGNTNAEDMTSEYLMSCFYEIEKDKDGFVDCIEMSIGRGRVFREKSKNLYYKDLGAGGFKTKLWGKPIHCDVGYKNLVFIDTKGNRYTFKK